MEVILKEDVKGLGYKNDVVVVKPGYGRNYLIPQGLALMASASNKKVAAENIKQAAHKAEKLKNDALALGERLSTVSLVIKAKAGESGKIFGSVTAQQIVEVLKEKGFEIDRRRVSFKGEVKNIGSYIAVIDLHKEVKQEINFSVVQD